MARRHADALKAKEKKQKILLAVLGVVFLGLAAFQGPKMWKRMHPSSPASTPTATAPTTTNPSLAAPTLGGGQAPASSTPGGGALASSPAPPVADGQLTSFSRFASKDPFAQQLSDKNPEALGSTSPTGGAGGGSSAGRGGKSSSGGASASDPKPGTAVISVNGTLYTVAVGTDFPTASTTDPSVVPLFHLISLTAHTAKISIVGGSYANGAPSVTLRENKPVTLMNTADGTRYKLILKPVGTSVPTTSAPSASSSSSTSTTPTSTTVTLPAPSSP